MAAKKQTFAPIDKDTARAVIEYAHANGRVWKDRLRHDWMKASLRGTLHRLRNTHGPAWLEKVTLDELVGRVERAD